VVRKARRSDTLFVWSEVIVERDLSPKALKIMRAAASFGMNEGVTIPILSHSGPSRLISFAGKGLRLSRSQREMLQIMVNSIHSHLQDMEEPAPPPFRDIELTRRESECLAWCLAGYTDQKIAQCTHSSPRTVQNHLANLQKKFAARNRAEMIAEAFRHGYRP